MICIIIILILLYIIYKNDIEPFNVDDVKFFPWNDGHSNEFKYLPNTYHMKLQKEHDVKDGLIPFIYDYMGKDSHHYLFESPILKDEEFEKIQKKDGQTKSYTSMIGDFSGKKNLHRPIYIPDMSYMKDYDKFTRQLDKSYINEPFKYPYRHPEQLGNKNSI